jgi:aspartyl-tRNA(Asn)/glutamyl-tRNA(Gln) amidotransferase subunit C
MLIELTMPTSEIELKKIATLAHIETDADSTLQFANDVNAIMNLVEQLRQVNTDTIAPLLHPLNLHQRLRTDEVKERNCIEALAKIAPVFADNLYLVPKVLIALA